MKFKNKILLASASLLVLSGAAASTGVFAWYTANRAAKVNVTTMTATSTEGTLTIDGGTEHLHGVTITKNTNDTETQDLNITPDTNAYLVDVTGDGHSKDTFKRPFSAQGNNVKDMAEPWPSEDAYKTNYKDAYFYYSFDLKFSIGGGDGNYGLLLSKSCELKDTDAKTNTDTDATTVADTVRLSAVINNSRYVYANINGNDSAYYTYSDSSDPKWTEVKSIEGGKAEQGVLTKDYFDGKDDGSTFSITANNYLGNIPAGDENGLTVTFYVWIEGHASANTDVKADLADAGNSSATFRLKLKFYTLKA